MTDQAPPHPFERLQSLLLAMDDIGSFLQTLARLATEVVDTSASCGLTVRYAGNLLTVGSSDHRAEQFDEVQYHSGHGPCLESLSSGTIVASADTRAETRWPGYTRAAREQGLRCSVSLPLSLAGRTFGAMNVYGFDRPHLFGTDEVRRLEIFAAQAAGTLRLATRQVHDATLLQQMEEALQSRTVIDQALGMIMAQQRCPADTAFALLRAESQNSRRRLRDVAADLVARTTGEPPRPGRPFDGG